MMVRWTGAAAGLLMLMACAGAPQQPGEMASEQAAASLACQPSSRMPLEGRASPYDSTIVPLGPTAAKVCYGRPFARGRTIFGDLVPYDTLWRTGANEPTIIHLPVAAEIAGIRVEPGAYSLYTVPGRDRWTIVVNRSTSQWGHESQYNAAVRAQEVGRAVVPASRNPTAVEQFSIRAEPVGADETNLVLEWENTQVRVPVRRI